MPLILYPAIPNVPGVPQILRSLLHLPPLPPLLNPAQAQGIAEAPAIWGVFDSGNNQVLSPDAIQDFDYRKEARVPSYQVEEGGFGSFNKVLMPFENVVRMTKGGTVQDRKDFLDDVDTALASLDLYSIVTPESSYANVNLTRVELTRRGASGAFFIEVDLFFVEIREVTAQYTSTAAATQNAVEPSALPPVNVGNVPPKPVTQQSVTALTALPNDVVPALSTSNPQSVLQQMAPSANLSNWLPNSLAPGLSTNLPFP